MDAEVTLGWDFILEAAVYCDISIEVLRNMTLKGVFKTQEIGRNKFELNMQISMQGSMASQLGGM